MPRGPQRAGPGGKRDFRDVPEGWYAVEITHVKHGPIRDVPCGTRMRFGCKVLDGPFSGEYIWFNANVYEDQIPNQDGVLYWPGNWNIRKLQWMIDPKKHPNPYELQPGEDGMITWTWEEDEFFMKHQFAVQVVHGDKKRDGGVWVNVKDFRPVSEATALIDASKSAAHSAGDANDPTDGPWTDEGKDKSESTSGYNPDDDPNSDDSAIPY